MELDLHGRKFYYRGLQKSTCYSSNAFHLTYRVSIDRLWPKVLFRRGFDDIHIIICITNGFGVPGAFGDKVELATGSFPAVCWGIHQAKHARIWLILKFQSRFDRETQSRNGFLVLSF